MEDAGPRVPTEPRLAVTTSRFASGEEGRPAAPADLSSTPPLDIAQAVAAARLPVLDFDGTIARLDVDWCALRADLGRRSGADFSGGIDAGLRAVRAQDERRFRRFCDVVAEAESAGLSAINVGIVEALRRRAGAWAVFSSNTRRSLRRLLGAIGLSPRLVVGKEDVVFQKPDPEGLQTIAARLGPVDLFVGDSEHDLAAGRAAGVRTLLVPPWRTA